MVIIKTEYTYKVILRYNLNRRTVGAARSEVQIYFMEMLFHVGTNMAVFLYTGFGLSAIFLVRFFCLSPISLSCSSASFTI